jgi:L-cysteine:1D-myo-inositol 2-amino-2-deoxy-alpha-D-glucopyranoside ligase
MCAGHGQVAEPSQPFAKVYSHAGMVAYDGEKMSKSRGNLVFVSALRNSDVDPMAIRLVLLRHHFRSDWEWRDSELWDALDTLADWRRALSLGAGAAADPVVTEVLAALADDLDAPRAVAAVQGWVDATLGTTGHLADTTDDAAALTMHALLDAALGLAL